MYFIIASAADTNYSRGLIVHLDIPSSIKTNGCKKSIIRTNTIKLSGKYLFFGISKTHLYYGIKPSAFYLYLRTYNA